MSKTSAGIAIICQGKILLVHPTRGADNMWGLPKGGLDLEETPIQAAIRETKEEIGYDVNYYDLEKDPIIFDYNDKKGKKYKTVHCYILKLKFMPDCVVNDVWPTEMLQIEEVDKAQFFTAEEAEKKIFWRMKNLLTFLK